MNLKAKLSQRIGVEDILAITHWTQGNGKRIQSLYDLIFDEDDTVAYQACWALTHFSTAENQWLCDKQEALIDEALVCNHPGKRRLLLNLLLKQPMSNPPRVDFLDFCLDRMVSKRELPGVQTLCMKLAYELCRPIPELLEELRMTLDLTEWESPPPSIRAVRKNVLKAMRKK